MSTTRARDRPPDGGQPDIGCVPPAERQRLAATFGTLLRVLRGARTQVQLADAAGMNVRTVRRLESGARRPTTSSVWRLARALAPPHSTLRDRVAVDQRLREAAGPSLRFANTRPHVARERARAELLAEAGGGPVVGDHETSLATVTIASWAAAVANDSRPFGNP